MKRIIAVLICVLTLFCGASAVQAEGELDTEALSDELTGILVSEMKVNLDTFYAQNPEKGTYTKVSRSAKDFAKFNFSVSAAVAGAMPDLVSCLDGKGLAASFSFDTELTWQEAASIFYAYERERVEKILNEKIVCEASIADNGALLVSVHYPEFEELVYYDTQSDWYVCWMALLYMNTLYDENGEEKDYVHTELSTEYLWSIAYPMDLKYVSKLKDGWYRARSQATRRHMGTDIKVPAATPILSCTNGVVYATGTALLSGNYVVIKDSSGYFYYYYHIINEGILVETGDKVLRGQNIALVGSTGNSDANHLHLSISTPDRTYLNPYLVLKDAFALRSSFKSAYGKRLSGLLEIACPLYYPYDAD